MDNPVTSTEQAAPTSEAELGERILSRQPIQASHESSEQEPSESTQTEGDDQVAEEIEVADEDAEAQDAEASADAETDEAEETDLLPNEQERDYADKVYARYAKWMGKTLEEVNADPRLRSFIKSKIDSDVYVKQKDAESQSLRDELEKLKPKEEEGEEEAAAPAGDFDSYVSNLESFATEITDPRMVAAFAKEYYKAWGVEEPTEEDMKRAPALVNAYTKFGVNLINTVAPRLIEQWMETRYPGVNQNWEVGTYQRAWDSVKGADERFKSLPAYGTPEFQKLMEKVVAIEPDFQNMTFYDQKGRPLSKHETAKRQYRLAAMIASSGEKDIKKPVEMIKAAVEKGKQIQQQAEKKRTVAKITGAGQSKGTFGQNKPLKGSGLGILEAWEANNPKYLDDK